MRLSGILLRLNSEVPLVLLPFLRRPRRGRLLAGFTRARGDLGVERFERVSASLLLRLEQGVVLSLLASVLL